MKYVKFTTLVLFIILLIGNLYNQMSIGKSYQIISTNSSFEYVMTPSKGNDHKMMERYIEQYKTNFNFDSDLLLCRTEKKNYKRFWMWIEYMTEPYWEYDYCKL